MDCHFKQINRSPLQLRKSLTTEGITETQHCHGIISTRLALSIRDENSLRQEGSTKLTKSGVNAQNPVVEPIGVDLPRAVALSCLSKSTLRAHIRSGRLRVVIIGKDNYPARRTTVGAFSRFPQILPKNKNGLLSKELNRPQKIKE